MQKRLLVDFCIIVLLGIAATQIMQFLRTNHSVDPVPIPVKPPIVRPVTPVMTPPVAAQPVAHDDGLPAVPNGSLRDGSFVRNGWWDYGSCNGDDQWMCGNYGGTDGAGPVACSKPVAQCASGKAFAVASQEGDRKCVITWWRWECQPANFIPWSAGQEPARIQQWRNEIHQQEKAAADKVESGARSTMPANLCRLEDAHPNESAEVIALGVYEGKGPTTLAKWGEGNRFASVKVVPPSGKKLDKPVVLVLTAYEPVEWIISPEITNIVAVVLSGYYDQRITGLKVSVPLVMSHKDNAQYQEKVPGSANRIENCTYVPSFYAYSSEAGQRAKLDQSVQSLLGHRIDRFTAVYSTEQLEIPDVVIVNQAK